MTKKVDLRSLVKEGVELRDSDSADIAALQLALDMTLNGADRGRVKQVKDKLNGWGNQRPESPWEVAKFCSYFQQTTHLELAPWMDPPCCIHTREKAEAILKKGPRPAHDDSGEDTSDCGPARLVLDMLDAGVSRWHPDPVGAIAEARQAKRSKRP
jgi:hypothetical protein